MTWNAITVYSGCWLVSPRVHDSRQASQYSEIDNREAHHSALGTTNIPDPINESVVLSLWSLDFSAVPPIRAEGSLRCGAAPLQKESPTINTVLFG